MPDPFILMIRALLPGIESTDHQEGRIEYEVRVSVLRRRHRKQEIFWSLIHCFAGVVDLGLTQDR